MQEIQNPLRIPELKLQPESTGVIHLSPDIQQTLSLLAGFWKNQRMLLKSSPSGILFTAGPPIEDIYHVTATSDNYQKQGDTKLATQVLVMAHPGNGSKVWARTKAAATVNNSIPLDAGDGYVFSITNLNQLHILIVADTEKAIVAYSI